jgi:dipeptidyl aminopeptidase/acylaminoacyl peptidase
VKPSDLALLRVVGPSAIAPDGRHVVAAVTRMDMEADEYRGELWLAGTGESAAAPRKLTEGPRDRSPRYSPDGRWLAFSPDGAAVYFTAVPLSQAGTAIPGSNCGIWSVPADGSGPARTRPAGRRKAR